MDGTDGTAGGRRARPSEPRLRTRDGMTLIELLTVTLIVGIIATIALPRLDTARRQAQFTTVTSDLRNLGAAQERYYQTTFQYALDLSELDFETSPAVELVVTEATDQGWAAVATHAVLSDIQGCAIYLGQAAVPLLPNGQQMTTDPGVIECVR